jgi:hypothetical protein
VKTEADSWENILFYLFINNSRNPLKKKTFKTQINFLSENKQANDEKVLGFSLL